MKEQILEAAFVLLSQREYSEEEIKKKLAMRFPESYGECEEVRKELRDRGYINDEKYAEHWTEYYASQKKGKQWIFQKLLQKGISKDIIENTLSTSFSEETEEKSAKKVAQEKLPHIKASSLYEQKGKLIRFLVGRGFSFRIAEEAAKNATAHE